MDSQCELKVANTMYFSPLVMYQLLFTQLSCIMETRANRIFWLLYSFSAT